MRRDGLYNWCKACDIWKRQERRKRKRDESSYTMAGGLLQVRVCVRVCVCVYLRMCEYEHACTKACKTAARKTPTVCNLHMQQHLVFSAGYLAANARHCICLKFSFTAALFLPK